MSRFMVHHFHPSISRSNAMYGQKTVVTLAAGTLVLSAVFGCWQQSSGLAAESPYGRRMEVSPLPTDVDWINTAGPLRLEQLRGKFVLLDFWTYCCINCMHILPELKKLERAYPDTLVVIGVHSAKFETEQDSQNIAEAVLRHDVEHPVVNDHNREIWKLFGVRAWPTLLLIDPEGYAVWGQSGETTFEKLDAVIRRGLPYYRKKGVLDETPLRFELEAHSAAKTPLRFPGKVLADDSGERLFIADSGHHRIVVATADGQLVDTIGSGTRGAADGDFASASFNQPQGMAFSGGELYLADTENHLIRRIDLRKRRVETIAGTGRQNRQRPVFGRSGRPRNLALSSPWALYLVEENLYIAMAGSHQIWRMDLSRNTLGPYAGNGREDIVDGPLLPDEAYQMGFASFAQPSGLASDGTWLYVADSEGSSIRAVPLDPRREVHTVVGTADLRSARLFTFGDVDGPASRARLQHPLGVVFVNDMLYVADTYNNKIKRIDPTTGRVETVAGTAEPGLADNPAQFDEPAGISAARSKLYVADTNNHAIRVIDPEAGFHVSTLEIEALDAPAADTESNAPADFQADAIHKLEPVRISGAEGRVPIEAELDLPRGYKLNTAAPLSYRIDAVDPPEENATPLVAEERLGVWGRSEEPKLPLVLEIPLRQRAGSQTIRISLVYYYCQEGNEGLCKAGSVAWEVPLRLDDNAKQSGLKLRHRVAGD